MPEIDSARRPSNKSGASAESRQSKCVLKVRNCGRYTHQETRAGAAKVFRNVSRNTHAEKKRVSMILSLWPLLSPHPPNGRRRVREDRWNFHAAMLTSCDSFVTAAAAAALAKGFTI